MEVSKLRHSDNLKTMRLVFSMGKYMLQSVNMSYIIIEENITNQGKHLDHKHVEADSPGGIWKLAGSCVEVVCGIRGATLTGWGPVALGTVITSVLPWVVAWVMEAIWLKAAFVTCGWILALTPPEVVTFDTTMTEGEEVCLAVSTVEEVVWWTWLAVMILGGAMTVLGLHVVGTCTIFTWTEWSPSPDAQHDSSFGGPTPTLFVDIIVSEKNQCHFKHYPINDIAYFVINCYIVKRCYIFARLHPFEKHFKLNSNITLGGGKSI